MPLTMSSSPLALSDYKSCDALFLGCELNFIFAIFGNLASLSLTFEDPKAKLTEQAKNELSFCKRAVTMQVALRTTCIFVHITLLLSQNKEYEQYSHFFFEKRKTKSITEIINTMSDSLKDTSHCR